MISSVSGGTFTAAYYALYRDRIFADYQDDFLTVDIDSRIAGLYLLPWRWEWMFNAWYGSNDQMARVYDELMFHGATYAELIALGPPMVTISATDVTNESVFPFNQDQFDLICSDLSRYPLARAVAASNGFPVVFTPITLENHAPECAGRRPAWIEEGLADTSPLSRRRYLARLADRYAESEIRCIHLMDGGISDNLALRAPLHTITGPGWPAARTRSANSAWPGCAGSS